jgi:Uma2 family endonuclease
MSPGQDVTIPRRATYEDYRGFPDDGLRYEILDGEIYMTPAPSPRHQYASKRLQRILEAHFESAGHDCLVFDAPIDVILGREDVVQPDLVVTPRSQISAIGIQGPPLLLVEILSPSRPEYDRLTKARRYAAHQVPHYWILDPDERTLECFRLDGELYRLDASAHGHDQLAVPAFDGLRISLAELWLDV